MMCLFVLLLIRLKSIKEVINFQYIEFSKVLQSTVARQSRMDMLQLKQK